MERKRRTGTTGRPKASASERDLVAQRQKLLESLFDNGRQIAGELIQEIETARRRLAELEADNARLRNQLRSDNAIRELLAKIEVLESERRQLLTHSEEIERQARSEVERAAAVEAELSNLASLYVAASQLHASLSPHEVLQTLGQLLLQFVGAGAYVVYSADGNKLVPVASEGVAVDTLETLRVGDGPVGGAFLSRDVVRFDPPGDEQRANGEPGPLQPLAVVPMRLGEVPVGAVVVYELLEQKHSLSESDFELLRMLTTQGATALAGARLYEAAGGALPALKVPSLGDR